MMRPVNGSALRRLAAEAQERFTAAKKREQRIQAFIALGCALLGVAIAVYAVVLP